MYYTWLKKYSKILSHQKKKQIDLYLAVKQKQISLQGWFIKDCFWVIDADWGQKVLKSMQLQIRLLLSGLVRQK